MNAYREIKFYTPLQTFGYIAGIIGATVSMFLLLCFY